MTTENRTNHNPHLDRQVCRLSMKLFGACFIVALIVTLVLFALRGNIYQSAGGEFKQNESGELIAQPPGKESKFRHFWTYKTLYQGPVPYLIFLVGLLSLFYTICLLKYRLIPSWWRIQKDIEKMDKNILEQDNTTVFKSLEEMGDKARLAEDGRLFARLKKLEPIYQAEKRHETVRENNDRLSATDEADVIYSLQPLNYAVWVMPILGFIGTVLGVTGAIDGLKGGITTLFEHKDLTKDVLTEFNKGFSGLAIAFNTTLFGLIGLCFVGTIQFFFKKSASFVILTIDKKVSEAISFLEEKDPLQEMLRHFFVTDKEGELEISEDGKPALRWQKWMGQMTEGFFDTDEKGQLILDNDKKPVPRLQQFIEKGFFVTNDDGKLLVGDDGMPVSRSQRFLESVFFMQDEDGLLVVDKENKPVLRWQQWMDAIIDEFFYSEQDGSLTSKSEYYRRQMLLILIRSFCEVTNDRAEEIVQGYIEGRDDPVPLRSQFERRHRQLLALLTSTGFLVEKSAVELEQIRDLVQGSVSEDSGNQTSSRQGPHPVRGTLVFQPSNTSVDALAVTDNRFVVSREAVGGMGEYEILTGQFIISPGGGHLRPHQGEELPSPEKLNGIGLKGNHCVCAGKRSKTIISYDLLQENELPVDIGLVEEGSIYANAVFLMDYNDMQQVLFFVQNSDGDEIMALPLDGSAPAPTKLISLEGTISAAAACCNTSLACATISNDNAVLTIIRKDIDTLKIRTTRITFSSLAFHSGSDERLWFGNPEGEIGYIDIEKQEIRRHSLIDDIDAIDFLTVTAAGQLVVAQKNYNRMIILDPEKDDLRHEIFCDSEITTLATSSSGIHLLVGCVDGSVYYWDVRNKI